MRTIDSFEDYVEPIDEAINDIFFQFFFAGQSASLMSCENYLPFRKHNGVWDTRPESWSLTAIHCLKVNNSTACKS